MSSLEELKRRKIVQWAVAYVAGAWVVLQLIDVLAGQFAWPAAYARAATILLASGLLVTLVLAWYHGERGRQRTSGPELLMLAGILVLAGAGIALVRGESAVAENDTSEDAAPAATSIRDSVPHRSIAVLPLDNHSPDPGDAYFAAAMTEALTNVLQKIPDLHVSARNSAEKYPESGSTVGQFAITQLGVAHALEGSVQIQDGRALVTVQLIDARAEGHIWSETYEAELVDAIDVQVRVAREVAERLATSFTDRAEERFRAGRTDDPLALDLYTQALEQTTERREDIDRRIALGREAVSRDPEFSAAWFLLGDAYYQQAVLTGSEALADTGVALLDRAIEVSDDPTERSWMRAFRLGAIEGRDAEAIQLLRPVVRRNPSDVRAIGLLTYSHLVAGELDEAVEWARQLARLDPLSAQARWNLGLLYTHLGLDAEAARALETAIELGHRRAPETRLTLHLLRGEFSAAARWIDSMSAAGQPGTTLHRMRLETWSGDLDSARSILDRVEEDQVRERRWVDAPLMAHVLLSTGDTARAERILGQAESVPALPSDQYAGLGLELAVVAVRGDPEAATAKLREATAAGWRNARVVRADPIYSRVRSDPEFDAALRELESIVDRQRREVARDPGEGE